MDSLWELVERQAEALLTDFQSSRLLTRYLIFAKTDMKFFGGKNMRQRHQNLWKIALGLLVMALMVSASAVAVFADDAEATETPAEE